MAKNKIPVVMGDVDTGVRKQGSWMGNNSALSTAKGDTADMIRLNMELASMPDVDLNNKEEVDSAIMQYFEIYAKYDMRPTVAGLAMVLGIDRRRLWEIKHGDYSHLPHKYRNKLSDSTRDSIQKAYALMENLWETAFNSGKINPVAGIFLAKNNYGYQDKVEYTVSPGTDSAEIDTDSIRQRYLSDSTTDAEVIDSDDSGDSGQRL